MRSIVAALAALLVLTPVVVAVAPLHGEVAFNSEAMLRGRVTFTTEEGGLDLAEAVLRGEAVDLAWTRATGTLVVKPWRAVTDPTGKSYSVSQASQGAPISWGPGSLRGAACAGACDILLVGDVGIRGGVDGPLAWLPVRSAHWGGTNGTGSAFFRNFTVGSFGASSDPDEDATRLWDAEAFGSGTLTLFVKRATLNVRFQDGGRDTLDARERNATLAEAGLTRVEEVEERYAVLRLEGASFAAPPGGTARFLAESPSVLFEGALHADAASGRVTHAGVARDFTDAPLVVEGRVALEPSVSPRPDDAVATLLERPTLRATLGGEADRVTVGGVPVGGAPLASVGRAAGVTGLALLLVVLLLAPLYSRISRGRALVNENRARLHGLIRDEPGVTAAELTRRVGLARMVVRHHLQLLEAHGLVTRRRDGRRQRYFIQGTDEDAPRFVLATDGRRRVFDALVRADAPLTQRDLTERTGLSQRLVSYHLARLEEAGGVMADAATPRRYAARTDWLSRGTPAAATGGPG